MNRNILRLLLSATFVMCCTFSAWAGLGTPPDDEIWYTSHNGNVIAPYYDNVFGATIQSNSYDNGKGVIKFNGPVTTVGEYAFYGTNLTSISLPNTVESIGYRAFYWMNYMKEISLGNSLETISNDAFRDCDGLETIDIPASVTSIGEYAFYDCNVLKAVYLGNSVTTIGNGAFYDCDALEVIDIPASVTSIGEYAFYDCNVLKFVAIGRGVTNIPTYAFYDCNELKSVAIDGNGMTLGYGAFYHCDKLESVSFLGDTPPSSYGDYCFSNCSANLKFHVLEEYYSSYNSIGALSGNVVKGPPYNEIWYTTNNGGTAGHTFPFITPPPLHAYMGNHGVQFFDGNPPTFDYEHNCFYYCTNLVSVVLPPSITYIGAHAFRNCTNLVSVSIPNTVTSIGELAFGHCVSLQTITIPDGVNSISTKAFVSCSALRSVTILGTIESIGTLAFDDCANLYDIFYFGDGTPAVVTGWDYGSFIFCPATIYVKDATGHSPWGDRPVRSWRSGKGDGSRENPLEIENYINLYGFALEVSVSGDNDLCGKLTADIVGNSNVLKADGSLNGTPSKEWLPIGSSDKVFCGEFNGNGHTISGLYHNYYYSGSCVGLFGRTGEGAYIHDLGLVDSYMSGGQWNAGICGDMAYGLIDNCYNAATVAWGGGITSSCWVNAQITNCFNVGHIYSDGGGITAVVYSNPNVTYSIENCYSLTGVSNNAINGYDGNCTGKVRNVETLGSDAFANGEVCWLLNGSEVDTRWRQQLGRDSYPVFSGNYLVGYENGEYYNGGMCNQSPNHIHFLTVGAEGTIPTTTETGRYGYYTCSYCHNKFMDKHGCIPATEESLTIPKAKDNEIWYTTSNHQKLTPNKTDAFGTAYNDANNVYELGVGLMQFDGNVTSIGSEAFHNCYDLTSITIPNSVTSIGYEAFMFCTNLTSITIPRNVTSIGEEAFDACRSITSIAIPSGVTSIGKFAIYNCLNLSSVTFHSLPAAGQYAVSHCDNLSSKALDLTDSDKPYIGTSLANYPGFTEAHYHGTLEPNQWGTIVLPFVPSSHSGIVFFSIDNVDAANGTLTLSVAENIEAGKPYLFRNQTDAASFTLTATPAASATDVPVNITASEQTVGDFALKGTFQAKELAEDGLYEQQDGEFVKVGSLSINPFRAYLKDDGSSALTRIVIDGGTLVKITNQDDSTVTLYGLKKVEFIEENGTPAVRVTYADDSTVIYTNPKKVDFGK